MRYELQGKIAVVTGGGSGIGAACVRSLAASGASVAVTDVDHDAAAALASELEARGATALGLRMDVADENSIVAAFAKISETFGRLDIAVNSAGIGSPPRKTADVSTEAWDRVLAVNLTGVFRCMRAELKAMRANGGGSIVNIASIMGVVAPPSGAAAYVAAKHGVVGLTKAAALDHASDGIRVNAVGPGYIHTPLFERSVSPDAMQERIALHPLGRLGRAEDVAELVSWLASESAAFVTGSFYPVDGGYLAR